MEPTSEATQAGARVGRVMLLIAALVVVASAGFSVGEISHARHATHPVDAVPSAPGLPSLSGLSISDLQKLATQVQQAANLAKSSNSDSLSGELSQLEQQFGISPSDSPTSQADQLQAELNMINACISGTSPAPPGC